MSPEALAGALTALAALDPPPGNVPGDRAARLELEEARRLLAEAHAAPPRPGTPGETPPREDTDPVTSRLTTDLRARARATRVVEALKMLGYSPAAADPEIAAKDPALPSDQQAKIFEA